MNDKDLETDFTRDAKSCQPTSDGQFATFREKDYNNQLIEHYLQYQPKEIVQYVKEFDFQFLHYRRGDDFPHRHANWFQGRLLATKIRCW